MAKHSTDSLFNPVFTSPLKLRLDATKNNYNSQHDKKKFIQIDQFQIFFLSPWLKQKTWSKDWGIEKIIDLVRDLTSV